MAPNNRFAKYSTPPDEEHPVAPSNRFSKYSAGGAVDPATAQAFAPELQVESKSGFAPNKVIADLTQRRGKLPPRSVEDDIGTGLKYAPGQILGGGIDALNANKNLGYNAETWLAERGVPMPAIEWDFRPGGKGFSVVDMARKPTAEELAAGKDTVAERFPEWKIPTTERSDSVTGNLIRGGAQFATDRRAIGKLFPGGKGMLPEIAKSAGADFAAFSGDTGRLSDILTTIDSPVTRNPVTDFLSTKPEDDDITGRLKNTLEGGILGTAIGGIVEGAKAGAKGFSVATEGLRNPPDRAAFLANRALKRDNITTDMLRAEKAKLDKMGGGIEETAPELAGKNTRGLTRALASTPGEGADAAQKLATLRREQLGGQASKALGKATGQDAARYTDDIEELIDARREASKPAYDEFHASPVDEGVFTRKIRPVLDTEPGTDALNRAKRSLAFEAQTTLAAGDQEGAQALAASAREVDAYLTNGAPLGPRALDAVKKGFDDIIDVSAREGGKNNARLLGTAKRNLAFDIDTATGGTYGNALGVYSGPTRIREMIDIGRKAMTMKDWELNEYLKGSTKYGTLTPEEIEGLSKGLTRAFQDAINENDRAFLSKFLRNKGLQNKLKSVIGDEKSFNQFRNQFLRISGRVQHGDFLTQGSPTARIAAEQADAAGEDFGTRFLTNIERGQGVKESVVGAVWKPIVSKINEAYRLLRYRGIDDEEVNQTLTRYLIGATDDKGVFKPNKMTTQKLDELITWLESGQKKPTGGAPPPASGGPPTPPGSPKAIAGPPPAKSGPPPAKAKAPSPTPSGSPVKMGFAPSESLAQSIAATGAGTVFGSAADQEDPVRGALTGAAVALGGRQLAKLLPERLTTGERVADRAYEAIPKNVQQDAGRGSVIRMLLDESATPEEVARAEGIPVADVRRLAQSSRNVDEVTREPDRMTFGGVNAKTADKAALAKAQQIEARGVDRDRIWKETGWGKGRDGQWRFEIDDSKARLKSKAARGDDGVVHRGPLEDLLDHPRLFEAYPELRSKDAEIGYGKDSEPYGSYSELGMEAYGSTKKETLRTTLHEGGHGAQDIEGFAPGGSIDYYNRLPPDISDAERAVVEQHAKRIHAEHYKTKGLPKRYEDVPDSAKAELRAQAHYEIGAGETEARNIERRANFSAGKRRNTPPWQTQDVPDDQQVVRNKWGRQESRPPSGSGGKPPGGDETLYHGTRFDFDDFTLDNAGRTGGTPQEKAIWFTPSEKLASAFGSKVISATSDAKLLTVDVGGQSYKSIDAAKILDNARKKGYDGVRFKNLWETHQYRGDPKNDPLGDVRFEDQIAIFNPAKISRTDRARPGKPPGEGGGVQPSTPAKGENGLTGAGPGVIDKVVGGIKQAIFPNDPRQLNQAHEVFQRLSPAERALIEANGRRELPTAAIEAANTPPSLSELVGSAVSRSPGGPDKPIDAAAKSYQTRLAEAIMASQRDPRDLINADLAAGKPGQLEKDVSELDRKMANDAWFPAREAERDTMLADLIAEGGRGVGGIPERAGQLDRFRGGMTAGAEMPPPNLAPKDEAALADLIFNPARAKDAARMASEPVKPWVSDAERTAIKVGGAVGGVGAGGLAAMLLAGNNAPDDGAIASQDQQAGPRYNVPDRTIGTSNPFELEPSLNSHLPETVRTAQQRLMALGFAPTSLKPGTRFDDGVNGPRSREAVAAFQRDNRLPVTGELDPQTLRILWGGKNYGLAPMLREYGEPVAPAPQ